MKRLEALSAENCFQVLNSHVCLSEEVFEGISGAATDDELAACANDARADFDEFYAQGLDVMMAKSARHAEAAKQVVDVVSEYLYLKAECACGEVCVAETLEGETEFPFLDVVFADGAPVVERDHIAGGHCFVAGDNVGDFAKQFARHGLNFDADAAFAGPRMATAGDVPVFAEKDARIFGVLGKRFAARLPHVVFTAAGFEADVIEHATFFAMGVEVFGAECAVGPQPDTDAAGKIVADGAFAEADDFAGCRNSSVHQDAFDAVAQIVEAEHLLAHGGSIVCIVAPTLLFATCGKFSGVEVERDALKHLRVLDHGDDAEVASLEVPDVRHLVVVDAPRDCRLRGERVALKQERHERVGAQAVGVCVILVTGDETVDHTAHNRAVIMHGGLAPEVHMPRDDVHEGDSLLELAVEKQTRVRSNRAAVEMNLDFLFKIRLYCGIIILHFWSASFRRRFPSVYRQKGAFLLCP